MMGLCFQLLQKTLFSTAGVRDGKESTTLKLGFILLNLAGENSLATLKASSGPFMLVDNC